ncbi:MAG TPA: MFS transporter, partial [Acidimicrobiales bacterium]|nr:MFS transporter [Acidimicrobiales bacterium]
MATSSDAATGEAFETNIPARLDRLPWARWHWIVLIGLGTVWILDGLEVTIVGAVGSTLTKHGSGITISTAQVGDAAGVYVAGACAGALLFGHLMDRFGRKRLFLVTLGLYLVATLLTATSQDAWMFFAFRFFTGMGIGGEYSAINSAIDELIPARVRGTVDLVVNGSYWLGTVVGAAATLALLDPRLIALDLGWRTCFFIGAVLGLAILLVRRHLPESPRWLFTHGRLEEAEQIVGDVEEQVQRSTGQRLDDPHDAIEVHPRASIGILEVAKVVVGR